MPRLSLALAVGLTVLFASCGGEDGQPVTSDADTTSDVAEDTGNADTVALDTESGDTEPVDTTPPGPGVAILEPSGEAIIGGLVPVVVAPTGGVTEQVLDGVRVDRDGATVFRGALLPDRFILDTAWGEAAQEMTLAAHAVVDGEARSDEVALTVNNRPYTFVSVTSDRFAYRDGQEVVVDVALSHVGAEVAVDFSELDSTWSAGDETVTPIGDSTFRVSHRVGAANNRPDGDYPLLVRATYPGWVIENDRVTVRLANRDTMPIRVPGAIEVRAERPVSNGWSEAEPTLVGNGTIVTGGTLALTVDFDAVSNPADVIGIILTLGETFGYVQVPLQNSDGVEELRLSLRQYLVGETPPGALTLEVALVDRRGRVSGYVSKPLDVLSVGAGDLQISVAWDSPTDVDLHVTGPGTTAGSQCTVYYANKTCASGGQLDLDSNPACNIDGINNENVFWDTSKAAPGDYTVELRYWSDCSCCSARYTVSVVSCGVSETFEGILAQGTSGSDSPKHVITTVSTQDCGRTVTGQARYQDRLVDSGGAHGWTWRPARHALVEVRREATDFVLATGQTDAAGRYRLTYANDGDHDVYVALVSKTDFNDAVRGIEVLDQPYSRLPYEVRSETFDDSPGAGDDRTPITVDLDVALADGSGAFNIFDQLVSGYDRVRRMTGRQLGTLRAFWTTGEEGRETAYCTKERYDADLCIEPRSVTIQGFEDDPDQFDDQVIQRAFFGFALDKASENDSPGGPADGRRVDARVAWAEGVAMFFAADVAGLSTYTDGRPRGVYVVRDLESPWSPFSRGTEEDGRVSPELVAAVLYDLADGVDAEASDPVADGREGIYDVIFNRLRTYNLPDRGPVGVELYDFLDGFMCRGYGAEATLAPILAERDYAYDFAAPESCP